MKVYSALVDDITDHIQHFTEAQILHLKSELDIEMSHRGMAPLPVIDDLKDQLRKARGKIKEQSTRIGELEEKIDELKRK